MRLTGFLTFTTAAAAAALFKREETSVATVAGSTVSTSVAGPQSTVTIDGTSTTITLSESAVTWTAQDNTPEVTITREGITENVEFAGSSTTVTLTEPTTLTLSIDDISTDVTFMDASTAVVIKGATTILTLSASIETTIGIGGSTAGLTVGQELVSFTSQADNNGEFTTTFTAAGTVLEVAGTGATLSASGTEVQLAVDGTQVTLTATSSSESSSESTTESSSESSTESTEESSTESSESTEETTSESSTESTEESSTETSESTEETTSESSTESSVTESSTEETSTESTTASESTDTTTNASSPSGPTPTLPPGTNPTQCEVVRGPLTPEEEVQLAVLFGDGQGGTAFADYVVSYASQLVAQIADVANIAVGDNDFAFTTAFDTIDIPGVLGLASAAPIYTCFLSTLWAQALSNPQQYAKRAVPSQDDKIKLIVLFEKRANDGMQFDYAELLVDDTNNLIAEVQSVAGAAGAAAVGGDLSAYASLFANVDVAQFLSIATEAPIYTEGLSSAFVTALESYSQNVNHPTSTVMVTSVYTSVSTIVTNVVSGTVTVPTTLFSTVVVTNVGPATNSRETYTSHTTETRVGVTSETVSEVVRETTLPNGQVTRVAEGVTVGTPGERVTVEIVTGANGRVETRTVTRREGGAATAVTTPVTATRPNVAHFTEVRGGTTYVHTVEIQHENAAWRSTVGFIGGIIGFLFLFVQAPSKNFMPEICFLVSFWYAVCRYITQGFKCDLLETVWR